MFSRPLKIDRCHFIASVVLALSLFEPLLFSNSLFLPPSNKKLQALQPDYTELSELIVYTFISPLQEIHLEVAEVRTLTSLCK